VTAPMGGNLVKWVAEDGAEVSAGEPVAVLEAMKMETVVVASAAGTFRQGGQEPGAAVARGEVLGTVS
jgi:acetyl-CoA/propionyl-CoA carboxylase biotin carboxyl carrier protein